MDKLEKMLIDYVNNTNDQLALINEMVKNIVDTQGEIIENFNKLLN